MPNKTRGNCQISEMSGTAAALLVDPFYAKHGSQSRSRASDLFFLAQEHGQLLGCVRYCIENETSLLRTMRVHEAYQRKGIGAELLKAFGRYLDRNRIRNTYCLPYAHLEFFYGRVGFQRISENHLPAFLNARLVEYRMRGMQVIAMKRA